MNSKKNNDISNLKSGWEKWSKNIKKEELGSKNTNRTVPSSKSSFVKPSDENTHLKTQKVNIDLNSDNAPIVIHKIDTEHSSSEPKTTQTSRTEKTKKDKKHIKDKTKKTRNGSKRKPKHKKKKSTIIFSSTLAVLVAIISVGLGAYLHFYIKVPKAISYLSYDSSVNACSVFKEKGFKKCSITSQTSSELKRGTLISQSKTPGKRANINSKILLTYSNGPKKEKMPKLEGLELNDAKKLIYNSGLVLKSVKEKDSSNVAPGVVISSSIKKDSEIKNGQKVSLSIASKHVKIPDWSNQTKEYVEASAKTLNIKVTFKQEQSDKTAGTVISQTPSAGSKVNTSNVTVVIAKPFEVKQIQVPDVIGKSASDAQNILAAAGFRSIKTVVVKNSEVTSEQVTQVVPGVGQTESSNNNVVIIDSQPSN